MSSSVAKSKPIIITRSVNEPMREGLTVSQDFDGLDGGLICCWDQGRRMARLGHEFVKQAQEDELPQLDTWRRGTLYYLAVWQGLRGDDLDIDLDAEFTKQCSLTKREWLFSGHREKRDAKQRKMDGRYLKQATLPWCWERGQELRRQRHRLVAPAERGELANLCLFPCGMLRYYAMWQGLRNNSLDVESNEAFVVQCSKTRRWWVFGPETRPDKKWRTELQGWLDQRYYAATGGGDVDV